MRYFLTFLFLPCILSAQSFEDKRDGHTYNYVPLGGRYWMTENLRYDAEASVCMRDCETIRFYDYRYLEGVCPEGWRLPSVDEWDAFANSFEQATKVRMFENKKKVYRVDFLDQYNIFDANILNIRAYGRVEGGRQIQGSSIDYWTSNQATDDRFHMHLTPYSIMGHRHIHHLKATKEDAFRLFAIRCVCEQPPD